MADEGRAVPQAAERGRVTADEVKAWADHLHRFGFVGKLVSVEVPKLPRSRALRRSLEHEAQSDPRIRVALDTCYAAERRKRRDRRGLSTQGASNLTETMHALGEAVRLAATPPPEIW